MMFLKKYINTVKQEPIVFLAGFSVLSLAVMGTSVRHVSSVVFTLLVLLSFTAIKGWGRTYSSLSKQEKYFLIALFLYTCSAALSFYNVDDVDQYYKLFERYLRFSLIIPVYLFFIKKNISLLNYLYAGAVLSGPFVLIVALYHYITYPDVPAQGYYHHIIFGQLAMLNVGVMLSLLLTKTFNRKIQWLILISILCGLAAAVMSQARGVWVVFPIYVSVAIYYAVADKRISKKSIALFLAVIVLASMFTSIGEVIKQRIDAAVSEVTSFYAEDQYVSSVGTRLAMWDIAIDVWKQYPLLGTGPGDFDDEVIALQKQGEYIGMFPHSSVHNIYIQALVDSGIIGLLVLIVSTIIMPVRLLFCGYQNEEGRLVGMTIVIAFVVFGLSESWTLRLPAISIFLVYMVIVVAHVKTGCSKNTENSKAS